MNRSSRRRKGIRSLGRRPKMAMDKGWKSQIALKSLTKCLCPFPSPFYTEKKGEGTLRRGPDNDTVDVDAPVAWVAEFYRVDSRFQVDFDFLRLQIVAIPTAR